MIISKAKKIWASVFFGLIYLGMLGTLLIQNDWKPSIEDLLKLHFIIVLFIGYLVGMWIAFFTIPLTTIRSKVGKALLLLGLGNFTMGAGFIAWFVLEIFMHIDLNELYPSIADFFYVAFVPCVVFGLIYLLRIYALDITKEKIIRAVCFTIIACIATFMFANVTIPSFQEAENYGVYVFDFFYAITDVVFIAIIVFIISLSGGRIYKGLWVYLAGLLLSIIADFLFFYRVDSEVHHIADIADDFYLVSGCVLSLGISYIAASFSQNLTDKPDVNL